MTKIMKIAQQAKEAARELALLSTKTKNSALRKMANALRRNSGRLLGANITDLKAQESKGASRAFIDRLRLDARRIDSMACSLEGLARLEEPVGEIIDIWKRPNGLIIAKERVPIGVIAIIYEARPNVTSDCIGLCLKSGNAVILRGGSDALHTNQAIYNVIRKATEEILPRNSFQLLLSRTHKDIDALLRQEEYIDLVMPRGGEDLIREVTRKSRIPVIKHYKGVCHIYVDSEADLNKAGEIVYNAKVQRPGVCNAMECLLVHEVIAREFLPKVARRLLGAGCELRCAREALKLLRQVQVDGRIVAAKKDDWGQEYLALILAVKVVPSLGAAIKHINTYGTSHSDAIVTESRLSALEFLRQIDSACVYVNASTRFTDGGEFGMGAEIGISTDKLHARGPVGLRELTTYKYIILGTGQTRKS